MEGEEDVVVALWETQEVSAEVLTGGKTWLDVAPGK